MQSNTPQFDALLNQMHAVLVPHRRTCVFCQQDFELLAGDIELLKLLRVPAPQQCPDCRNRNRLAFANYATIHKRQNNFPGRTDYMISLMSPQAPWITYDYENYYSDQWDPFDYGRVADPSEDFFAQFLELAKVVPKPGVKRGSNTINSDYSFGGKFMKDCYYLFGGRRSEDVMYSASIYDSKHIVDSYFTRGVEIGYENVTADSCYRCQYAYFSIQCVESDFMFDCRGCQNCFGCVNLRNKSYCWFNEQLTRDEYMERRAQVDLGSRQIRDKMAAAFWDFVQSQPVRAARILQSENVTGNDIKRSKNCYNVFQAEDCENVRHMYFVVFGMKDSMDSNHCGHSERVYNGQNTSSVDTICSLSTKESTRCGYMMNCVNCHDCFGCIGIKNASYCIFNQQYSENEYFEKLDQIKTTMLQNGTYGEFFPLYLSPYPYNTSLAHVLYPMSQEQIESLGLIWHNEVAADISQLTVLDQAKVPDNIDDVQDDLSSVALICQESNKPYRVLEREINYYRQSHIPIPDRAPYQRMLNRFHINNDFRVTEDTCSSCGTNIHSAYSSAAGWQPHCEECYLKKVA